MGNPHLTLPGLTYLILLRHGESALTADGRFAGWTDVKLSLRGQEEALHAAELLAATNIPISVMYTSVLQRSIATARVIENHLRRHHEGEESIEEYQRWQLNERCYGQLEGKNKKECSMQFGTDQVRRWRRSFTIKPPQLEYSDPRWPGNNPMYAGLQSDEIPAGEAPIDVEQRVRKLFDNEVSQHVKVNKNVMIVGHGTSVRCLMKILEDMSVDEVERMEVPSCVPVVYGLDPETMTVKSKEFLVSEEELAKRSEEVRLQSELDAHTSGGEH